MQENGSFNEQERIMRQLEALEGRFEELSIRITLPEVISDGDLFRKLMREHSEMAEMAEVAKQYRQLVDERDQAREMLSDPDMAEMAQEELEELEERLKEATHQARLMLLPKDPDDYRDAVIEVRAGAGGDEAGLFGAELVRMYIHYAERRGWKAEIVDDGATEIGGIKEAVLTIQGKGVFSRLKYESGVHRVQRVPVTESSGRIHTSTATVASGAGGQHVNRTDSAVRITHLPTGLVVTSQDQRSQIQNREKAMRVLKSKLYEMERRQRQDEYSSERKSQVGTGDRSERIRTYNFPQGRVTDHRIGLTLYRIDDVMNGDLDEIIDALILAEQTQLLEESEL